MENKRSTAKKVLAGLCCVGTLALGVLPAEAAEDVHKHVWELYQTYHTGRYIGFEEGHYDQVCTIMRCSCQNTIESCTYDPNTFANHECTAYWDVDHWFEECDYCFYRFDF